jgi:Mn2+/Fe2+ NRAMP family transporter
MMKRIAVAVLLSIPGVIVALSAKPLTLGEGILFSGVLLAFILPFLYLAFTPKEDSISDEELHRVAESIFLALDREEKSR